MNFLFENNKTEKLLLLGWKTDIMLYGKRLENMGINISIDEFAYEDHTWNLFINMMKIYDSIKSDKLIKALFIYPLRGCSMDPLSDYPFQFTGRENNNKPNNKYSNLDAVYIELFKHLNVKLMKLIEICDNYDSKKLFLLAFHSLIFQYIITSFIYKAPINIELKNQFLRDCGNGECKSLNFTEPKKLSWRRSVNLDLPLYLQSWKRGSRFVMVLNGKTIPIPPITTFELVLISQNSNIYQWDYNSEYFLILDNLDDVPLEYKDKMRKMNIKVLYDADTNKHNIHIYSEETRQFLKRFLDRESEDFLFELLQQPQKQI